ARHQRLLLAFAGDDMQAAVEQRGQRGDARMRMKRKIECRLRFEHEAVEQHEWLDRLTDIRRTDKARQRTVGAAFSAQEDRANRLCLCVCLRVCLRVCLLCRHCPWILYGLFRCCPHKPLQYETFNQWFRSMSSEIGRRDGLERESVGIQNT